MTEYQQIFCANCDRQTDNDGDAAARGWIKLTVNIKLRLVNAAYLKARIHHNEEPQNIRYSESPSHWIAMFEISSKSTWAVIKNK